MLVVIKHCGGVVLAFFGGVINKKDELKNISCVVGYIHCNTATSRRFHISELITLTSVDALMACSSNGEKGYVRIGTGDTM